MASLAALALSACGGAGPGARGPGPTAGRRTYTNPPSWAPPPGYTHAVATGGGRLLFLSGQVPLDARGQLVGGADFEAQARQVFENIKTVLASAGASFDDVVKMTYLVVGLDAAKVKTLRAVRDVYLPAGRRPASTLFGVPALFRDDVLLEVEATAELPAGR